MNKQFIVNITRQKAGLYDLLFFVPCSSQEHSTPAGSDILGRDMHFLQTYHPNGMNKSIICNEKSRL
jgi:hypothetical protein